MAEHLDRRADRQHRRAPLGRALQTGMPDEVLGGKPLRVVLGTAERVQVERLRHRVVEGDLHDLGLETPHAQPLCEHHRVATVAVGAHDVGQHQSDPHRRARHLSRRFSCRNAV